MAVVKISTQKELRRHASLVRQSYDLLEGNELRKAIDIAYEAIQKKNGRINYKQLKLKNDQLDVYLMSKAEFISKWA